MTSDYFHRFSEMVAKAVGSSWAFLVALGVVGTWAVTGPRSDYSDTWQLLINTGTTVVTFPPSIRYCARLDRYSAGHLLMTRRFTFGVLAKAQKPSRGFFCVNAG